MHLWLKMCFSKKPRFYWKIEQVDCQWKQSPTELSCTVQTHHNAKHGFILWATVTEMKQRKLPQDRCVFHQILRVLQAPGSNENTNSVDASNVLIFVIYIKTTMKSMYFCSNNDQKSLSAICQPSLRNYIMVYSQPGVR